MTEQEFLHQIWKAYDTVMVADGCTRLVHSVCFATRSVRLKMADGSLEWFRCELIEQHTASNGKPSSETEIIEDLHNKLLSANEKIDKQQQMIGELREQIKEKDIVFANGTKGMIEELQKATNLLTDSLAEKKSKFEKIERAIAKIDDITNILK